MTETTYLPCYTAEVSETGLGDTGLNIKCFNSFMPAEAGEVFPMFNGLVKLPAPIVGDRVIVLQMDASNIYRYYIPIDSDLKSLEPNPDNIQIESAGDVEVDGVTIKLGVNATEAAVLGDTLKQWLTDLNTAISAITVVGNVGVPTSPPLNTAQFSALTAQLINILSTKVTIE